MRRVAVAKRIVIETRRENLRLQSWDESASVARASAHYLGGTSLLGLLAALVVVGLFSADSLGTLSWVQLLLGNGLGAGSAMTLLVVGVGTNISTLGPVARVMGRQTAVLDAVRLVGLAAVIGVTLNHAL